MGVESIIGFFLKAWLLCWIRLIDWREEPVPRKEDSTEEENRSEDESIRDESSFDIPLS